MSDHTPAGSQGNVSRRDFLRTSAAVSAAALTASSLGRYAYADSSETLRIGLVGCGGRGTGAAIDAINADSNVKLIAMGDVFEDKLNDSYQRIQEHSSEHVDVPEERRFVGFDAYQKVIETDCDVVILTTPPGFRPQHLEAAVAAGKHIFAEKPLAVDPTGIRKVMEVARQADEKNLGFVVGFQRHYQDDYRQTIARIQEGAIGDVVSAQCYWNQGGLWVYPRRDEWSDMEWHLRNWYYFEWLSGDHIVEQHVHNIDVVNWVLGQQHPVRAVGMGGRQARTGEEYGHIYDHFAIEFEYPDGQHLMSMCRQIDGCANRIGENIMGTKGTADPAGRIHGDDPWRFRSDQVSGYVMEHRELYRSIRDGEPINDGHWAAESTLSAIMGKIAAYTGQTVEWDQVLNAEIDLRPERLAWDAEMPVPDVAVPGQTRLL